MNFLQKSPFPRIKTIFYFLAIILVTAIGCKEEEYQPDTPFPPRAAETRTDSLPPPIPLAPEEAVIVDEIRTLFMADDEYDLWIESTDMVGTGALDWSLSVPLSLDTAHNNFILYVPFVSERGSRIDFSLVITADLGNDEIQYVHYSTRLVSPVQAHVMQRDFGDQVIRQREVVFEYMTYKSRGGAYDLRALPENYTEPSNIDGALIHPSLQDYIEVYGEGVDSTLVELDECVEVYEVWVRCMALTIYNDDDDQGLRVHEDGNVYGFPCGYWHTIELPVECPPSSGGGSGGGSGSGGTGGGGTGGGSGGPGWGSGGGGSGNPLPACTGATREMAAYINNFIPAHTDLGQSMREIYQRICIANIAGADAAICAEATAMIHDITKENIEANDDAGIENFMDHWMRYALSCLLAEQLDLDNLYVNPSPSCSDIRDPFLNGEFDDILSEYQTLLDLVPNDWLDQQTDQFLAYTICRSGDADHTLAHILYSLDQALGLMDHGISLQWFCCSHVDYQPYHDMAVEMMSFLHLQGMSDLSKDYLLKLIPQIQPYYRLSDYDHWLRGRRLFELFEQQPAILQAALLKDDMVQYLEDELRAQMIDKLDLVGDELDWLDFDQSVTDDLFQWLGPDPDNVKKCAGRQYWFLAVQNITGFDLSNLPDWLVDEIENSISTNFETYGLNNRNDLEPLTWLRIYNKDSEGRPIGHLKTVIARAITQGWDRMVATAATLEATFNDLVGQFPSTIEEWQALMIVMGPMLVELGIDIGTDFIPIVGEIKGFTNAWNEFQAGNYWLSGLEFIGAVAGIVPIGDIINAGANIGVAAVKVFTSFKVIKALANVSGDIYAKIRHLAQNFNWKFKWRNSDEIIEVLDESDQHIADLSSRTEVITDPLDPTPSFPDNEADIATTTIRQSEGWALKQADAVDNAPATIPTGANNTYLGKINIGKNGQRIKVEQPGPLKTKIDEFMNAGTPPDPDGVLTEQIDVLLKKEIYPPPATVYDDVHYSGNKGFDNVVELPDGTIIIGEAKQMPDGSVTLGNPSLGSQMSDEWVDKVANKMIQNGGDQAVLGQKVLDALYHPNGNMLAKTVSAIDRSTGEIVITKLGTY